MAEKKKGFLQRLGFGRKAEEAKAEPVAPPAQTPPPHSIETEAPRDLTPAERALEEARALAREREALGISAVEQAERLAKERAEKEAAEAEAKAVAERAAEEAHKAAEAEEKAQKAAEEKAAKEAEAARAKAEADAKAAEEKAKADLKAKQEAEAKAAAEAKAKADAEEASYREAEAEAARAKAEADAKAAEEKAKAEREAAEREAAEAKAREEAEAKTAAQEKAAAEEAARAEAERLAKGRAATEKADAKAAEDAKRKAEAEAKAKAEKAKTDRAAEKAERERLKREQAKADREAAKQAKIEADAEAKRDAEARAKAEAEEEERIAKEKAEREAREAEERERLKAEAKAKVEALKAKPKVKTVEEIQEAEGTVFQRFSRGLKRSSSKLGEGVTSAFQKRLLDEAALEDLEDMLIASDLGVKPSLRIVQKLEDQRFNTTVDDSEVRDAMAEVVAETLGPFEVPLKMAHMPGSGHLEVVLFTGVNGSGKTTTLGKLAAIFRGAGYRILIAAADTFRAAANEQLAIWAERAEAPILEGKQGADAAGLVFDAMKRAKEEGYDILLIDTAGRLQNRTELMDELEKIVRVIKKQDESAPHHSLLVLDATVGQNALSQVEVFKDTADVTGLVMTKLDGTAKGGVLVNLADKHGLPIHFIGIGERLEDLEVFRAEPFAKALAGAV